MNQPDQERHVAGLAPLDYYYYLAPVWFVAEKYFWPNLRAGVVFGDSPLGIGAFYCAEGLIGAALWARLRYAAPAALAENLLYLVLALKYVLYAPIDAALALAADTPTTAAFARHYTDSLPGIIYSVLHVVLRIRSLLPGRTA
jgi:hypothetical protein